MHLDEGDAALLKKWVIKKLEDISDADSEVLADYVLALIRNDDTDLVAKANCIENLQDFLPDNAESFVNDVFTAIATKAYDPSRLPLKPTAGVYVPPRRGSFEPPRQPNESRKRSYHDWDRDEQRGGRTLAFDSGDRPMKQVRRGGKGGAEQRGGYLAATATRPYGAALYPFTAQQLAQLPQMPAPSPGMPAFDPSNPLAALLAMQQAMGLFPGFPNDSIAAALNGSAHQRSAQRCRDYDIKGFCARGANCPYEHGEDPYVVPYASDAYDPQAATLSGVAPVRSSWSDHVPNGRSSGRGRGRGGAGSRGGGSRAPISLLGQNYNQEVTSIVVEQIPEDYFDEQVVRDFFGQFGTIEEVTMQPYKHLAVVKFDSYDAARAAYDSPKVIFENRFVKVFWRKPENSSGLPNGHTVKSSSGQGMHDIEMQELHNDFDADEFSRRQEEAQRKHDEAKKQRDEIEKRKKELDDSLRKTEDERKRLAALLAKKLGKPVEEEVHESEQTKALRAQLAKLEAEAKSLGIDPEDAMQGSSAPSPPFHGRGGFRGRPCGRGQYPSFRGGWPGAGGRAGAVMRLDNRPKTVCVAFENGQYEDHDEALRQYLMLNSMDTASLSKHPDRDNAALVAFPQRYELSLIHI